MSLTLIFLNRGRDGDEIEDMEIQNSLHPRRHSNSNTNPADARSKFEIDDFDEIDEEAIVQDGEGCRNRRADSGASTSTDYSKDA